MVERRRRRRTNLERDVAVSVAGNRPARLMNISADGALLELSSALNPRVEYRLTVPLFDGAVRVRARVTRCRLVGKTDAGAGGRPIFNAGLEFLDVDQKLALAIELSYPAVVVRPVRRGPIKVKVDVGRLEGGRHGAN